MYLVLLEFVRKAGSKAISYNEATIFFLNRLHHHVCLFFQAFEDLSKLMEKVESNHSINLLLPCWPLLQTTRSACRRKPLHVLLYFMAPRALIWLESSSASRIIRSVLRVRRKWCRRAPDHGLLVLRFCLPLPPETAGQFWEVTIMLWVKKAARVRLLLHPTHIITGIAVLNWHRVSAENLKSPWWFPSGS